jgi:hypothetical protein
MAWHWLEHKEGESMAQQLSGVITVATAGTEVAGPAIGGTFLVRLDPANTGTYGYIGNDGEGAVGTGTGYKSGKSDPPIVLTVSSLATVKFDVDTSGDKWVWLRINAPDPHDARAA